MSDPMISTIDGAGRFVLPKPARTALGLQPGHRLKVEVYDGRVELVPVPIEAELVEKSGLMVITPTDDVAELTNDEVRRALEQGRG